MNLSVDSALIGLRAGAGACGRLLSDTITFVRRQREQVVSFAAGKPRQLFERRYGLSQRGRQDYDISPDGQRFLMLKPLEQEQAAQTQINVVLNWTEELKRLVPLGRS